MNSYNEIYDAVSKKIKLERPDVFTVSSIPESISQLPCISIVRVNSYSDPTGQTSESTETRTNLIYEINVYSNKQVGRHIEAEELASVVDKYMCDKKEGLGFIRTSNVQTPNLLDSSIYRLTLRYRGKVGDDNVVYTS